MREVTAENAEAYLREKGRIAPEEHARVRELSGGVSNLVLRVDIDDRPSLVLKQARRRLRVAMEWFSRLERIWFEVEAMRLLADVLPPGTVPEILFEDRENYLYAMACAPESAATWKSHLMAGRPDPALAKRLGAILSEIHQKSVGHPRLDGLLADGSLFDELRVDPYYRTTARAHPDMADAFGRLIADMDVPDPTLVLGDFSPKNVLVHPGGVILLDFECAHRGDPAFDVGFCLSHLILKLFRACSRPYLDVARGFLEGYCGSTQADDAPLLARAGRHAAACLLARLDGKSPVEYRHELDQDAVRRLAREALAAANPPDAAGLLARAGRSVGLAD